jgi:hypothetical protein
MIIRASLTLELTSTVTLSAIAYCLSTKGCEWQFVHTAFIEALPSTPLGLSVVSAAKRYFESRCPTSCVVPCVPNPLKWHVAHVGAGMSTTVSLPGF